MTPLSDFGPVLLAKRAVARFRTGSPVCRKCERSASASALTMPKCRTKAAFGMLILAALIFGAPSLVKAADDDSYCADFDNCGRNVNGAFGLTPQRIYRVVMNDNDSACGEIIREMNSAITGDIKAERTIPDSPFDNALYSGAAFLRWNYLKGEPGSFSSQNASNDDESGYRWLVAPVFNDGRPVLVTTFAAVLSNGTSTRQLTEFWHIEPIQTTVDWSDPRSYAGMKPLSSPIKPDEIGSTSPVRVDPGDDPLERTTMLYQYVHFPDNDLNYLPKLPREEQSGLWGRVARLRSIMGNETSFALIDGVYYTLVNSGRYDVFLVFRLHPDRVGDDVCYIESDLSQKLWRH